MPRLEVLATLSDGDGGRCRIYCDGRQNFLFERTRDGVVVERFRSSDPNRFHRYVYELSTRGWTREWGPGH